MPSSMRVILILVLAAQLAGCAALVVGGAAATGLAVHDRRSVGTIVDDNALKVRIRDRFYGQGLLNDEVRIKISTHNGWVLLAGEAQSEDRVALAGELAENTSGVRRLFNELEPVERSGPGTSASDRWLGTRVKTSLTGIRDLPGFDATRVKVTTARGIVYLMGMVSPEEAAAASERASTVRGVERVITLFEHPDERRDSSESNGR